jgi:hypothetical protein
MTDQTYPLTPLSTLTEIIECYSYDWYWCAYGSLSTHPAVGWDANLSELERARMIDPYLSEDSARTGDSLEDAVLVKFGYWEDGEQRDAPATKHPSAQRITFDRGPDRPPAHVDYREVELTYRQLTDALHALAKGTVTNDDYHRHCAMDLLNNPLDADGDYWTTDLLIQWAAFGEIVFG